MMQRTQIYVDTSYLLASFYNSWDDGARPQLEIDLPEVVTVLDRMVTEQLKQPVHRQLWYDGIPDSGPHRYQRSLRYEPGVQLRAGQLIEWGGRRTQKGVDTRLVADMVSAALRGHFSDMVLVSGDADMLPGVEEAVNAGVRVHLYGFGWDSMSALLRFACDSTTVLDPREDFRDTMRLQVLRGPLASSPEAGASGAETVSPTSAVSVGAPSAPKPTPTGDDGASLGSDAPTDATAAASAAAELAGDAASDVPDPASVPTGDAPAAADERATSRDEASGPSPMDGGAPEGSVPSDDAASGGLPGRVPSPSSPADAAPSRPASAATGEASDAGATPPRTDNTAPETTEGAAPQGNTPDAPTPRPAAERENQQGRTSEPGRAPDATGAAEQAQDQGSEPRPQEPAQQSTQQASPQSSQQEAPAERPTPKPSPSMMAPRRKLRSRYVPLPDELWLTSGAQTAYDVGQQYAVWWFSNAATEAQKDDAHLLTGGPLPAHIDHPLLRFASDALHEYTLNEIQRVQLRDGFHKGIQKLILEGWR